jgi:hypothetical protein
MVIAKPGGKVITIKPPEEAFNVKEAAKLFAWFLCKANQASSKAAHSFVFPRRINAHPPDLYEGNVGKLT